MALCRLGTPIMRVDRIFNGDASDVVKEVKPEMRLGQVHPSNEAILESGKARSLQGMRFLPPLSLPYNRARLTREIRTTSLG